MCGAYHVGQRGHATLPQASELVVHPGKADELPSGDAAFHGTYPHTLHTPSAHTNSLSHTHTHTHMDFDTE